MVSKARLDLPLPERPVMTISLSRGISTSRFLRLCSRAPRTVILSEGIGLIVSDRCERPFHFPSQFRGEGDANPGPGLPGFLALRTSGRLEHRHRPLSVG